MSDHDHDHDHGHDSGEDDESPKPDFAARAAIVVEILPWRFGYRSTLGRLSPEVLYDGPHGKWPFIQVIPTWSLKWRPVPHKFRATYTSAPTEQQNGWTIVVEGTVQWRPDPTITVQSGRRAGQGVFVSWTTEAIERGIDDRVEGVVGAVGGQYDGDAFVKYRDELLLLINCELKLRHPPHDDHNPSRCGVKGCAYGKVIPEGERLQFYRSHRLEIEKLIAANDAAGYAHQSLLEQEYGVDFGRLEISLVDFDEKTKDARGAAGRAELMKKPLQDSLAATDLFLERHVGADTAALLGAAITLGTDKLPMNTNNVNLTGLPQAVQILASALGPLGGQNPPAAPPPAPPKSPASSEPSDPKT